MAKLQLNSIAYSKSAVDISMLLLRVGFGILMIPHGYAKLLKFGEKQNEFMDFMGMGPSTSLVLAIFAELICSSLLVLGLFTRAATVPLIVTAIVITFLAHDGDIFGKAYGGFSYLLVYIVLLLIGPGKYSLDRLISSKNRY
jgi:putative oxidoreductase